MSRLVIQANLHHCKAATDILIQDMLRARNQVVALIQEPYVGKRDIPAGIPKVMGCFHHHLGGRVAILRVRR